MKRNNERGFTLMELMVVIVIVAILAAVAVPLYINYVKDARRTEAKAAIGALATAMEEYYLRVGDYDATVALLTQTNPRNTNLDQTTVDEIDVHWDITITGDGTNGYAIKLDGDPAASAYTGLSVTYTYTRGTGGVITEQ